MKSGGVTIIIFMGLAIALGVAAFMQHKLESKPDLANVATTKTPDGIIHETPRTDAPAEVYTRFFAKKEFVIEEEGQKRAFTYHWFEPKGKPYPQGLKFPLVMILHGAPGNAYAAKHLLTRTMQMTYPAFILIPMAPLGKNWAVPDKLNGQDVAATFRLYQSLPDTVALIRQLASEYPVDTSRIYAIGCSDGGGGAYGVALRYPGIFAATVPISGLWDAGEGALATKVPMLVMHGAHDAGIPAAGAKKFAEIAKKSGGRVYYTEFPDMDHACSSPELYSVGVWKWLLSQKKAG